MAKQMKTLNGYEVVDQSCRDKVTTLENNFKYYNLNKIIYDSKDEYIYGLRIYGRTEVFGTPSPSSPSNLVSLKDPYLFITKNNIGYFFNGGYYETNGNFVTNNSYKYTYLIKVPNGKKILYAITDKAYSSLESGKGWWISFISFDKNVSFISGSHRSQYNTTNLKASFSLSDNEKYIIVSTNKDINLCISFDDVSYETTTNIYCNLYSTDLYGLKSPYYGNVYIDSNLYYSDYIDVERGKIVRMVGCKIFNGSENWVNSTINGNNAFYTSIPNLIHTTDYSNNIICNYYPTSVNHWSNAKNTITGYADFEENYSDNNWIYIITDYNEKEFKNFLSNNPITVIYRLKEPEEENINEATIKKLQHFYTYYPVTNVQVGNVYRMNGKVEFTYNAQNNIQHIYDLNRSLSKSKQNTILSGSTEPSGGNDGDFYVMY